MVTGTRNEGDLAFFPVQTMKSYRDSRGLAPLKVRR